MQPRMMQPRTLMTIFAAALCTSRTSSRLALRLGLALALTGLMVWGGWQPAALRATLNPAARAAECGKPLLTVAPGSPFEFSSAPEGGSNAVVAADFNKDGKMDAAMVLSGAGVAVRLGDGAGGFGPFDTINVGNASSFPVSIAVGDFNKDGNPDFVTANVNTNFISVLKGNGAGGFSPLSFPLLGQSAKFVTTAHLNGDSNLDLVLILDDDEEKVVLLFGDGTGMFPNTATLTLAQGVSHVLAKDINGDGDQDLVIAEYDTRVVRLLGNGNGTFQAQTPILTVPGGEYFGHIAAGDFNEDGKVDLAVPIDTPNTTNERVNILTGDGLGNFTILHLYDKARGKQDVLVEDFDQDGHQDIVLIFSSGFPLYKSTVSLMYGDGDGNFTPPFPQQTGNFVTAADASSGDYGALGDFNGDGRPDVIVPLVESGAIERLAMILNLPSCDDDADDDGVSDAEDNCPAMPNPNQADNDDDGAGDVCDADDDNDGVPDGADNCSAAPNSDQLDTDADGIGNVCDFDDDNDGVADINDNCPQAPNSDQADADGDGIGNVCDADDDNDGIADAADNCQFAPNPDQSDNDADGAGNACDPDDDNDGVPDSSDNCPLGANADQLDTDADGAGDACDADDDNDGVLDPADNCQFMSNPNQADTDGDGTGDVCDPLTYNFTGFFQPVDNLPMVNKVKAGRSVPVKFSLGGDYGLSIFAAGSPTSVQTACNAGDPASDVEQTVTAGASSLSYDPLTTQYTYVWKTNAAWAGTCRQLVVSLKDGSVRRANFNFTK